MRLHCWLAATIAMGISGCSATGGTPTGTGGTLGGSGGEAGSGRGGGGGGDLGSGGGTGAGGSASLGGSRGSGGVSGTGGINGSGGTTTSSAGGAGSAGRGGVAGSAGGAGGAGPTPAGGVSGTAGAGPGESLPCDIYASANTPCVGAHSTVRALYRSYDGPLYQVQRASDKTTKDIPLLAPGGFANSAVQDSFCAGTSCVIWMIYDQSPQMNHLPVSPPVHWLPNGGTPTNASAAKITISGHAAYGVYVTSDVGNTYRNNKTKGVATGDQSEAMYMVVDGTRYNGRCCFDYGNAETTGNDDGNATMETLEWGNITTWARGGGNGPWVSADLENGVYMGSSSSVPTNTPLAVAHYATLMLKGPSASECPAALTKSGCFTLKGADAQAGALAVKWDGARPAGYSPQKKEGAIELGTGGDGSAGGIGTFFEGAITAGVPSDAVDDAVQANIVAAGYGH